MYQADLQVTYLPARPKLNFPQGKTIKFRTQQLKTPNFQHAVKNH